MRIRKGEIPSKVMELPVSDKGKAGGGSAAPLPP